MEKRPEGMTCETCIFFDEGEINPENVKQRQYQCRRNPPQVVTVPSMGQGGALGVAMHTIFPPVTPANWCGEWDDGQDHDDDDEVADGEVVLDS